MAVLLKHLDLGHVASHVVEYGLSESGRKLGLPRSLANVCKAVYETKRALIKVIVIPTELSTFDKGQLKFDCVFFLQFASL